MVERVFQHPAGYPLLPSPRQIHHPASAYDHHDTIATTPMKSAFHGVWPKNSRPLTKLID